MSTLPSGTVTFVFSDIEGSTTLLKQLGDRLYADLLAVHRRLVREIFAGHNGQEIDTQGDAFFYSFVRAREAVAAAVEVQRSHAKGRWPGEATVRLRLGLHTGEPAIGEEGYTGLDVVRASRIAAIGRGGQVLLSDTTRAIVTDDLPDGVSIRSLGERALRDLDRPEPLSELLIPEVTVAPDPDPPATGADPTLPGWPFTDAGAASSEIPEWVQRTALRFLPEGGARDLIEQRVLDRLTEAFNAREDRPSPRGRRSRREPKRATRAETRSVAEEIERLRALRDSGALTEEQYARAVDRAITDGT